MYLGYLVLVVLLRVRHPRPWCLTCCYLVWLPVSSARWSIKAAETAVDAVITEMNQRLPSVAEALVTLKAFRFLEVRRPSRQAGLPPWSHAPPPDAMLAR